MRELEHLGIELSGTNLIEASAGTGKTYAIACLYLRLIVESDLSPEQILVVTYTEAATEELRGRIRSRIREALNVLSGTPSTDPFLQGLLDNANGRGPGVPAARERLDRALKSFDLASISTIHGFCLRALQDNAFESGSLYDTELVTDQSGLLQEVVDDFWRRTFFAKPAPLLGHALAQGLTPGYFSEFLRGMLGNPKLEVLPSFLPGEIAVLEEECLSRYRAVRAMWQEGEGEIKNLLLTDKGLSRSATGKYALPLLPPLFAALELYLLSDNPFDMFKEFGALCSSCLLQAKKKTGLPLQHPFFDLCEELLQLVSRRFLALRCELLAFVAKELPARKRELNVRCFDDLLTGLYDALLGPRGPELALCLRTKYRAALIDEFQDTDPVQFDIFRTVYADPAQPLFLIGDPKQAIYSFRGADIFAYLAAAAGVSDERRFTLTSNYRSTPRLLAAFNAVFDNSYRPFLFDQIAFHPVSAGLKEGGAQLELTGSDPAPLQLWCLPLNEAGKPPNMTQAGEQVCLSVAAETARLLQEGREGRALIEGKPLLPEHIAIIVRSHRQAADIQDALNALCIPSVMRSDASIMETPEAAEVGTLLAALAAPGNEPKVRAALVTDLLGLSGDDVAALLEDEALWEEWLGKFREYHQNWLERGFMVMVQALMSREGVRGRLLAKPDGERRLTNLLHCFEIIHAASQKRSLGAEGLAIWFAERLSAHESSDEYQIRLETDEKAVKILTVHVSKGLQFPVVFCPFLWSGVRGGDEVVSFHLGDRLMKDFGSPDQELHRVLAQKESLAENLRLLYVALTRAQYRCYLVAGKIDGARAKSRPESSPLSYLFHASPETRCADDPVSCLVEEVKALPSEVVVGHLEAVAARHPGSMAVTLMPEAAGVEPYRATRDPGELLAPRVFAGAIERDWRVASFTSLAAHESAAGELPDHDRSPAAEAPAPAQPGPESRENTIFNFPKGAHAGIFLHEIFEKYDFAAKLDPVALSEDLLPLREDQDPQENQEPLAPRERGRGEGASPVRVSPLPARAADLVQAALKKHGFGPEWQDAVCGMVEQVVTTPFSSPEGPFTLSDLKQDKWLCELEFFFPLKFVTSEALKQTLTKWSGGSAAVDLQALARSLRFRPAKGMLKGFMDLIFEHGGRYYLVDWKSNHLGHRVEAYGAPALKGAMEQNLYSLQYLLYTVALNRYLSLRVPDYRYQTHFGGVLYLFLRGMDRERGEEFGVFRDTPSQQLIEELTNCLIQAGG
jgi:exodeoxyribonuclease V beta subunit